MSNRIYFTVLSMFSFLNLYSQLEIDYYRKKSLYKGGLVSVFTKIVIQKIFWLFLLLVLPIFSLEAQQKNKDFKIQKYLIVIHRMTPEVEKEVSKVKRKEQRTILLKRTITQADFDWACRAFGWMRVLKIYGNKQIDNIAAISQLDSLKVLSLTHLKKSKERPIDLQPLTKLTALTSVNFQGTHLKDTAPLSHLKELQKVNFDFSDISSISFLCSTPKVQELILTGPRHTFDNYDPVTCLKDLRVLNVYHNKQATDEGLDTLKVLTSLREFTIHYNKQITTLDFLKNNLDLETIRASRCNNLKDFAVLSRFKKLVHLGLGSTRLKDLSVIEGLTKLVTLNISYTRVKDISVLENCLDLRWLDISKNSIADLTPLYNCRELKNLKVNVNFNNRPLGFYRTIDSLKTLNPEMKVKKD